MQVNMTTNNSNSIYFNGKVDKSTMSFFNKTKQNSLLPYITNRVKDLHKDTIIKIEKHTDIYLPLKDSMTNYLLVAKNKKIDGDIIIANLGTKNGILGKIKTSFKELNEKYIKKTMPQIDKIFVQHAKNLNTFTNSTKEQTQRTQDIINFSKEAKVDYKKDITLSKYPLISRWW